ncbi:MAG: hypothetical protein GC131_06715 [Alphaproteobacteria bacterium]|nr:hypothetical protein [Alphaproteobacteria bacterium]
MAMSKESMQMLIDLVEIKLSTMQVSDRDDMREMVMLQRCLSELRGARLAESGVLSSFSAPRRGRRRKVAAYA